MRIRIPVVIDIDNKEISKLCKEFEVTESGYRAGLVEDKTEIVQAALEKECGDMFQVDHSRIEVS